jgi:exopolyphosphatase/guanosine-5'-triphosphate,3'-diphosphate pyrophosphatase
LSGLEEAEGIARGILGDPALPEFESFTAFDLGGGSLELMYFEDRQLKTYHSFELGSVRLMEMFFSDPSKPIPAAQQQACARHLHETLAQGSVPLKAPLVGCGGGLTVASRMLKLDPQAAERTGSVPPHFFSKSWFESVKPLVVDASKVDRLRLQGIPESRADIFPVAILTCGVLMDLCAAGGIHHTTHNLRFGIAHDLLGIPQ